MEQKILPYVYKCTHKITSHFYIGYREANKIPAIQDLPLYRTSSKIVNPHFDDYTFTILLECENPQEAYLYEQQLIRENWKNPLILNQNIGGKCRRSNRGKVVVTLENGKKIQISTTDPRYINGELKFYAKGIKRSAEFKEKQSKASKGKVNMKDPQTGIISRVSMDDPRIESRELIPMNNGTKRSKETKKKQSAAAKTPKKCTVCRIDTKKEMPLANFLLWVNGKCGQQGPKTKICRIFDKREMSVNHYTRWIKSLEN